MILGVPDARHAGQGGINLACMCHRVKLRHTFPFASWTHPIRKGQLANLCYTLPLLGWVVVAATDTMPLPRRPACVSVHIVIYRGVPLLMFPHLHVLSHLHVCPHLLQGVAEALWWQLRCVELAAGAPLWALPASYADKV